LQLISQLKLRTAELLWGLPKSLGSDSEWSDCKRRLVEDGCVAIEEYVDTSVIDRLVEETATLYRAQERYVARESNGTDERIYGVERLNDSFKLDDELREIDELSRVFYRPAPVKWFQLLGRITFAEQNLGSGSGWHRDSPFSHQFKAILYLSDVGPANGPFEYIVGSHRERDVVAAARFLGLPYHTYRFPTEQVDRLESAKVVSPRSTFVGRRGTLLLADTRGLHRGQPLKSGSRLALTRYYFPWRIPEGFTKNYPLTR
jgi:hypothetical protein